MRLAIRTLFFSGAFLLAALAAGAVERPVVFVSIPPQAWLVGRLAGGAADVRTLLASGANPHTFEPGARQVKRLADASLYLTMGMPFEKSLVSRASKLNPALKVSAMDAGVAKIGGHAHGSDHGAGHACCEEEGGDPHIWLSPRLFCAMASNAVVELERLLPPQRESLRANLERTVAEIGETERFVRESLGRMTVRTWVAYHPSWSYFAEEFGLSLLVIEADGKAPAARHLAGVIGQARAAGVRVVFAEPQYDRRPAQTLAAQIGARVETLDPLREDWPELMRDVAEKLAAKPE